MLTPPHLPQPTADTAASPGPAAPALPAPTASLPTPELSPGAPRWHSDDLLRQTDEALIVHSDQVYRLRRTGTGKLILTK